MRRFTSAKRVIAVAGATGAQGGGLARAILDDPASAYCVRALVRDPSSEKAQALARAGADVVRGDIDDEQSLTRSLRGAYGAFFEQAEAAVMARAARAAGLKHVIWSTLEEMHFTAQHLPTTYLLTCACWEHLIHFGWGPKRTADGRLAISFPTGDQKIPWIGAEDIGKCAYGIFKAGTSMIGRTVGVSGEHLSGREIAAALARALGEPVDYIALKPDQDRALGLRDFNDRHRAARDVNEARRLNPALQRFDDWLRDNAKRIPTSRMESEHA